MTSGFHSMFTGIEKYQRYLFFERSMKCVKLINDLCDQCLVNREKRRNIVVQKPGCSASLWARITSLQQQLAVLQNSKRTTVSALENSKEENKKLTSLMHLTEQRLQASKQTIQVNNSFYCYILICSKNKAKQIINKYLINSRAECKRYFCLFV